MNMNHHLPPRSAKVPGFCAVAKAISCTRLHSSSICTSAWSLRTCQQTLTVTHRPHSFPNFLFTIQRTNFNQNYLPSLAPPCVCRGACLTLAFNAGVEFRKDITLKTSLGQGLDPNLRQATERERGERREERGERREGERERGREGERREERGERCQHMRYATADACGPTGPLSNRGSRTTSTKARIQTTNVKHQHSLYHGSGAVILETSTKAPTTNNIHNRQSLDPRTLGGAQQTKQHMQQEAASATTGPEIEQDITALATAHRFKLRPRTFNGNYEHSRSGSTKSQHT